MNNRATARLLRAALGSLAALAGLGLSTPAWACTLCSCSASTSGMAFGAYDPTASTPTETTGTISLNCTGVVSLLGTIEVSAGGGSSGNALARTMKNGASSLNYNIYTDSPRTIVLGNGSGGTSTISAPLNGLLIFSQSITVYGRVPQNQWVQVGSYADNVVITITY